MSHLLSNNSTFNPKKGIHTAEEISKQPKTWTDVWEEAYNQQEDIKDFFNEIFKQKKFNIVLTGAGSSAFIGNVVTTTWKNIFDKPTQAIPTTDLVTHFTDYIHTGSTLLLISFARSGNSPESNAAIQLANSHCQQVFHLIITCNPDGKLAKMEGRDNTYVFLLPDGAEDKSLAMTNSFTSMTLAAMLIPQLLMGSDKNEIDQQIERLSQYGQKIVQDYADIFHEISLNEFNKIVFLGSGSKWGIARESHLKVQELTDGKVVGKFDSFLGFRHGPKAIIDDQTLLVYLISNKQDVFQYEKDLISQIHAHDIGVTTLAITEKPYDIINTDYTVTIEKESYIDDNLWAIACTLPAQIIGFYKSLALNYDPDNPSPDGTISRVVEGVTIY